MKPPLAKAVTALLLAAGLFIQGADHSRADEGAALIGLMQSMQTFLHKTALSLDNDNLPLAGFYAHELEEAVKELLEIQFYDNYPIADLTRSILLPALERFESALESDRIDAIETEFDNFMHACNACHAATGHDFIRIVRTSANPFMQSFKPYDNE